jgi:hypothetical protein
METIKSRLSTLSVDQVAEIAASMSADVSDEAGLVLELALEVLESKMQEADFVRFCEKLAA